MLQKNLKPVDTLTLLLVLLVATALGTPAFAAPPGLEGTGSGGNDLEGLRVAPVAMACTVAPASAQDDSATAGFPFDVSVEIDLLANDAAGVQLGYVGTPSYGSVQVTGPGKVTYTLEEYRASSTDQFSYSVTGCLQCHNGWCSEPDFDFATVYLDLYFIE